MTTRDETLIRAALELAAEFIDSDDSALMSKHMMAGALRAITTAEVLAKVGGYGKEGIGPVPAYLTCSGCPALRRKNWHEPSGDGETFDSGTETIVAAAIQIEGVTISLPKPARHAQVLYAGHTAQEAFKSMCRMLDIDSVKLRKIAMGEVE